MEQKEPSMEEILSSIRRILSTEEGDSSKVVNQEAIQVNNADNYVQNSPLELTSDMMIDEPLEVSGNEDEKKEQTMSEKEGLLSEKTTRETTAKLSELTQVLSEEKENALPETSLEGMVRSLLTPYLKEWLNTHLPEIVEKIVQREVRRLVDKSDLS